MNYRQWKKQYKKLYGNNPGIEVDKRKQAKFMKRAVIGIDWGRMATTIKHGLATLSREVAEFFTRIANGMEQD